MIPIRITILTLAALFAQGCATQHQQIQTAIIYDNSPDTMQIMDELLILFISAESFDSAQPNHTTSAGPQLVAGDWLAWQCASAGNYWEIDTKNAPAYAEAINEHPVD